MVHYKRKNFYIQKGALYVIIIEGCQRLKTNTRRMIKSPL